MKINEWCVYSLIFIALLVATIVEWNNLCGWYHNSHSLGSYCFIILIKIILEKFRIALGINCIV